MANAECGMKSLRKLPVLASFAFYSAFRLRPAFTSAAARVQGEIRI